MTTSFVSYLGWVPGLFLAGMVLSSLILISTILFMPVKNGKLYNSFGQSTGFLGRKQRIGREALYERIVNYSAASLMIFTLAYAIFETIA